MFDSIKLYMPQERAGTTDMLAQTPVHLDKFKTIQKGTLTHYRGTLKNLSIYVSERGVSIRNSLAKYYLGDNIQTLNRKDTEQAINQLSDELHLPIQKADVSRIDFAQNFIMQYKPTTYYPYLGDHQYLKRFTNPMSLYYQNKSKTRKFSFYDKVAETGRKNIPERLKDSHILRYEIRYKRRLGKQLKEPEITAGTLFNEQFYIKLVDRYISDYQSIHKNAEINLNTDKMDSPKDFWRQIALMKIDEIGINRMMQMIDEWRAKDIFTDLAYYSRLKKEIRDYSRQYKANDATPLIEELGRKISRVKRNYR